MNWAVTWGFKSNHPNGTNFTMVDGSVRFMSQNVDVISVWRPLATIAGGEMIPGF